MNRFNLHWFAAQKLFVFVSNDQLFTFFIRSNRMPKKAKQSFGGARDLLLWTMHVQRLQEKGINKNDVTSISCAKKQRNSRQNPYNAYCNLAAKYLSTHKMIRAADGNQSRCFEPFFTSNAQLFITAATSERRVSNYQVPNSRW
jgi:hypothetical protein